LGNNCRRDRYYLFFNKSNLQIMENYILPYALFMTIAFFFAIIALVFAFKCGSDAEEEIEKLAQENSNLIKKLHEKL